MPRRPAAVTQADIARVLRAVKAAGMAGVRVVVRSDGISIEPNEEPSERPVEVKRVPAL